VFGYTSDVRWTCLLPIYCLTDSSAVLPSSKTFTVCIASHPRIDISNSAVIHFEDATCALLSVCLSVACHMSVACGSKVIRWIIAKFLYSSLPRDDPVGFLKRPLGLVLRKLE